MPYILLSTTPLYVNDCKRFKFSQFCLNYIYDYDAIYKPILTLLSTEFWIKFGNGLPIYLIVYHPALILSVHDDIYDLNFIS